MNIININNIKYFFVIEKPHRFAPKLQWWTLDELKNRAADIITDREELPADFEQWDADDYASICFADNHSYKVFDPAQFKNGADFVKAVKEFACHSNHNNVDEEAVDLALEMK